MTKELIILTFVGISFFAGCTTSVRPLPNAHSHNDYLNAMPLFDALNNGFCSIEADIWLIDGKLLVAHDGKNVDENRTLESLYLKPLFERINKNNGWVYSPGQTVFLLVDIKSQPRPTYAALKNVLKKYSKMLTVFTNTDCKTGAVTVIISGNRPTETIACEQARYVAVDGREKDLQQPTTSKFLMPLISLNWQKTFRWDGNGTISADERKRLKDIIAKAHAQGKMIRFWSTPEKENLWRLLYQENVDLIGTDALLRLKEFLLEAHKKTARDGRLF